MLSLRMRREPLSVVENTTIKMSHCTLLITLSRERYFTGLEMNVLLLRGALDALSMRVAIFVILVHGATTAESPLTLVVNVL